MARDRTPRSRSAQQLPPGRHGLLRPFVKENQRRRIIEGVADVVSLVGYADMSVEDILGAAEVSRRTFYDHFRNKEHAFLAAYDAIGAELSERVDAAYRQSESFALGVIACLAAFLEFAAAEPRYADLCIVEVLGAGPAAIERRNTVMSTLAHLLHTGAQTVPNGIRPPEPIAETLVGGIYEIAYSRVLQGRTDELPGLLPDLAYSTMLPYLGHVRAKLEVQRYLGSDARTHSA
jgi:AcrR family transcriptional regulator